MKSSFKCFKTGFYIKTLSFIALSILCITAHAQKRYASIDPEPFDDDTRHWYGIADKSNIINPLPDKPCYKPTEIIKIANNILLLQRNNGGWLKNYDVFAILTEAQKDSLIKTKNILHTTYDNGTTYSHIACLANVFDATGIEKYKTAALKGFDFILQSQYNNGGWPQYYPLEDNYSRCVTYNDGVMTGIMQLLKDVADNKPEYAFIDKELRAKLTAAYEKGMNCILKTQIIDNDKPTAWAQQYDEVTLVPAWGRKFEPPAICSRESAELVTFLMSIDDPEQPVVDAVQSAVAWFKESEILYTRWESVPAPPLQTPYKVSTTDRVVVTDSLAPPIWTRYYELHTRRPLFCNRDSKVVYSLAEVARERRDGYGWYTYAPKTVLKKYHTWQQKWAPGDDVLKQ